jgi:hypothetical protein
MNLPLAKALDRIPGQFSRWFFGFATSVNRDASVLQQLSSLTSRTTETVWKIFDRVYPFEVSLPQFHETVACLKADQTGDITTARCLYRFLFPIWCTLSVEAIRRSDSGMSSKSDSGSESWPLTAEGRLKLTDQEFQSLRDWVLLAEDFVALHFVRWFAPAICQLWVIIRFLVLASLSLLLAITSYPFARQGWLLTWMATLLSFVAVVIGVVVIGSNRDEFMSRVSDTAPNRLTLDGRFAYSALTMIVPLLGALAAVSFDLADVFRTLLGPLDRLIE